MTTLGSEYPKEQKRVRELIGIYESIGPPGEIAVALMQDALRRADEAAVGGDLVKMLICYQELQGFEA